MIVGFDIDDTITQHPKFFSLISHALFNAGHKVIIITFREDRQIAENDLKQWNILYNKLITSTLESSFEYGVNEWKAEMCRQNNVDIFFDDDPRVIKHIDASTFCIMPIGGAVKRTITK